MDLSNHPRLADDEADRLAALLELGILDTAPEKDLDELTRLAAHALRAPSAAISLLDRNRQWFASRLGVPWEETPREVAFCHHTVEARRVMVVTDARADPKFCDNPLVTAEGGIRFYAGAPLFTDSGHCIGTLCVIDSEPRTEVTDRDLAILEDCARIAAKYIRALRGRRMGEIAAKVVHATSDAVLAADRTGAIVYWNPGAERMFGYSSKQAIGQNVALIIPEQLHPGYHDEIENAAAAGPTRLVGTVVELEASHADGHMVPVELSLAPWGEANAEGGFAAILRDISDRRELEIDRQRSRAFLDTIIENLPAMLFVKDAQTRRYLLVNRKAEEMAGRTASSMIGKSNHELFADLGKGFERRDAAALAGGKPHVHESEFTRDDGARFNIRTTRVLMDGPDRPGQYLLGMAEDLTDFRRTEAENYRLARYDTLTGLLNRTRLSEMLDDLVLAECPFAMLSIDLDRFKAVNDQFGHLAGDEVLQEIGNRLRDLTADDDRIARIGGDEFVAVLTGEPLRHLAALFAQQLMHVISRPIATRRITAHVGASIGIVVYPEDGHSTERLRENADLALYRAKNEGRGSACFFDNTMDEAVRDRRKLERDLRQAVDKGQISLQYQPIIDAKSGRMTSVEALARWRHDRRGSIAPDIFISLAEDCGLVDILGKQLLRQACIDATAWRSELSVAVNLSPLQFQSGELVDTIRDTLRETGLAPQRLLLEVTERLVIHDSEQAFAQLEDLRALGIQLLIDDFGVGYSSLNYFQRFAFDKVKIDKSFIAEIENSRAAKAIVQAVVGLGQQLSMDIVAEGVETEGQGELLVNLGCTHLQGYLFSRPLDAGSIDCFLPSLPASIGMEAA